MTILMIGNEQDSFSEMIEVAKTEANSFDDLDEVVGAFGESVGEL